MAGDSAANWLTFKGRWTPLSRGQTGQLQVHVCWFLVAKVAANCGIDAGTEVAGDGDTFAVAMAEGRDAEVN